MKKKTDWNDYAKRGLLSAVIDPNDRHGYKNRIIDDIHWHAIRPYIRKGARILDFGCGTGRFYGRIQDRGATYLGIDTSQGMIDAARQFNGHDSAFICDRNGDMDLGKQTFDVVLSINVLQYVIKTEDNRLGELHDALRPGGLFVAIEQASESNGTSGTVAFPTSQKEYRDMVGARFGNVRIIRVRRGGLSFVASKMIEFSIRNSFAFPVFLPVASLVESFLAKSMGETKMRKLQYYDILIVARAHG